MTMSKRERAARLKVVNEELAKIMENFGWWCKELLDRAEAYEDYALMEHGRIHEVPASERSILEAANAVHVAREAYDTMMAEKGALDGNADTQG